MKTILNRYQHVTKLRVGRVYKETSAKLHYNDEKAYPLYLEIINKNKYPFPEKLFVFLWIFFWFLVLQGPLVLLFQSYESLIHFDITDSFLAKLRQIDADLKRGVHNTAVLPSRIKRFFTWPGKRLYYGHIIKDYGLIGEQEKTRLGQTSTNIMLCERKGRTYLVVRSVNRFLIFFFVPRIYIDVTAWEGEQVQQLLTDVEASHNNLQLIAATPNN